MTILSWILVLGAARAETGELYDRVDLIPTLGLGFLAGMSSEGNEMLALVEGSMEARFLLGDATWMAVDIGVADFVVPYLGISFGGRLSAGPS